MDYPPQADSPSPDSSESPETPEKAAAAVPKKATATQFFLKGLAIVLPPILTLVILVWIGQMIYGYVVSPITTGVRFVIAEVVDKSRPTLDLVPAPEFPPLPYCGNEYRIPPQAVQDTPAPRVKRRSALRRRMDKYRRTRRPFRLWRMSPTFPLENGRSRTSISRRWRPACGRTIGPRHRPGCTWNWSPFATSRAWAR